MPSSEIIQKILSSLPKVDLLADTLSETVPRRLRIEAARNSINRIRNKALSGDLPEDFTVEFDSIVQICGQELDSLMSTSLRPLVNATGVVIHTNLGRSPLPEAVLDYVMEAAKGYSNLEYDLEKGRRGSRYSHVEDILCELTGAEAALVVNNNAAAVLITLETLAKGREVIVSRGELVEIGGSFRIPDVMARSGAILREVGATNRTHLRDYENAIKEETALLMKVHQSNFAVTGFTKSVNVSELKELGEKYDLPVIEDLGSGTFTNFSRYGMMHEPTVQEAVKSGADLVSFSGDKLLGGPQAGIIVGSRKMVDRIKKNPINRAVRIDKLTLAALEGILRIYRDPVSSIEKIPALKMLVAQKSELEPKAHKLFGQLSSLELQDVNFEVIDTVSRAGGGALPLQELKSYAVAAGPTDGNKKFSAAAVEKKLRECDPPIIVRLEDSRVIFDVRTLVKTSFPP